MRSTCLLLCALGLIGCATAEPHGAERITVLTYNIHHGAGADGRIDLERIARVVRDSKADLVALQEVDESTNRSGGVSQVSELARLTGLRPIFGAAMPYDGGEYGDAVLSRFAILSAQTLRLPWHEGDRREPRVALEVVCRTRGGGRQEIVFVSTHLDHTREPSDRLEQANQLNAAYRGDDRPVILAGDFNCEPATPPMRELSRVWLAASNADDSPTSPADAPVRKIDHVLVKPLTRWLVNSAKVIDERVASDHRPVVVTLELIPAGWVPRGGLVADKR